MPVPSSHLEDMCRPLRVLIKCRRVPSSLLVFTPFSSAQSRHWRCSCSFNACGSKSLFMPDTLRLHGWLSVAKMERITTFLACSVVAPLVCQATAQPTPIAVVGVQTGVNLTTGQRPARQNINNLHKQGGPQW